MPRTSISGLREKTGQIATVQGWVQTIRDQKRMLFLLLRDATGCVQAVLEKAADPALAESLAGLSRESAVSARGRVLANPQARLGGIELRLDDLRIESPAVSPLPFDPFAAVLPGPERRLDWRFLDLRRPENQLLFRVQTTFEQAMRDGWRAEGFVEIHTPKLMGSPSESGAELFALDYFGGRAYLAQSPQFYKQMAIAAGLDRVFEIGPVFRADPSFTTRHTTEFTSVDVEIGWIESHAEVMAFEERWLAGALAAVDERHGREIADRLGVRLAVPALPFPRLSLEEALAWLAGQGHRPAGEGDLDPQGERMLGERIRRECGHEFVFVTDYPAAARPFYHMRDPAAPHLTRSYDLLWKGLEITTGAQREHRRDRLAAQAAEKGIGLESIQFYLDFFSCGCPPHGGFGLGLARVLMVLLERASIRETSFLPRTPNRLYP
jgi:nondiscriminating aspartyl-tRNA synthetase